MTALKAPKAARSARPTIAWHPLFPRADGSPEDADIRFVTFLRRVDGVLQHCPEDLPRDEVQTWSQVMERWGGGDYQAIAKTDKHVVIRHYPNKGEWMSLDGEPLPFVKRGARQATAAHATRAPEATAPPAAPPALPAGMDEVLGAVTKLADRLDRMQERMAAAPQSGWNEVMVAMIMAQASRDAATTQAQATVAAAEARARADAQVAMAEAIAANNQPLLGVLTKGGDGFGKLASLLAMLKPVQPVQPQDPLAVLQKYEDLGLLGVPTAASLMSELKPIVDAILRCHHRADPGRLPGEGGGGRGPDGRAPGWESVRGIAAPRARSSPVRVRARFGHGARRGCGVRSRRSRRGRPASRPVRARPQCTRHDARRLGRSFGAPASGGARRAAAKLAHGGSAARTGGVRPTDPRPTPAPVPIVRARSGVRDPVSSYRQGAMGRLSPATRTNDGSIAAVGPVLEERLRRPRPLAAPLAASATRGTTPRPRCTIRTSIRAHDKRPRAVDPAGGRKSSVPNPLAACTTCAAVPCSPKYSAERGGALEVRTRLEIRGGRQGAGREARGGDVRLMRRRRCVR